MAMKLDAVAKESPDAATSDLQKRLSQLQDKLTSRNDQLTEMSGRIGDLDDDVRALEQWIVTVVQNLQGTGAKPHCYNTVYVFPAIASADLIVHQCTAGYNTSWCVRPSILETECRSI